MTEKTLDYKVIFDSLRSPILILAQSGDVVYFNAAAVDLLQIDITAETRKRLKDFLLLDNHSKFSIDAALTSGKNGDFKAFIFHARDVEKLTQIEAHITELKSSYSDSSYYLMEITKGEDFTIHAKRIRTLGKATGDIAHGISNPLSIIQINCETLAFLNKSDRGVDSATLNTKIDKLSSASERIIDETNKLKSLSLALSSEDDSKLDLALEMTSDKPDQDFH